MILIGIEGVDAGSLDASVMTVSTLERPEDNSLQLPEEVIDAAIEFLQRARQGGREHAADAVREVASDLGQRLGAVLLDRVNTAFFRRGT